MTLNRVQFDKPQMFSTSPHTTLIKLMFNIFLRHCKLIPPHRFFRLLFAASTMFFAAAAVILIVQDFAAAQNLEVRLTISPTQKNVLRVAGKTAQAQTKWVFADYYANADKLAARIENLRFFDAQKRELKHQKLSDSEFVTSAAVNFEYDVKLDFPVNAAQAAHVSWLENDRGLMMPADLLPVAAANSAAAKIIFDLPSGWRVAASENPSESGEFTVADFNKTVFFVGNFTEQTLSFGKISIKIARDQSAWSFSEAEALEFAKQILTAHEKVFDSPPIADKQIQLILLPLPQKFGGEQWEAETRGSSVVILSAVSAFKSRALSKLHEQLRHELFHLWIPNGIKLTGDYAWFYEGFTIYQALKTGVRLKYIRFADFLDVLSRAFDAAERAPQNKSLSLLEASRLRWSGGTAEFVYAKGMITAFLCDLSLLENSGGKRDLDEQFRRLYNQSQREPRDANKAILELLKQTPELANIVARGVETANPIEWTDFLTAAGLQNVSGISLTRLAVNEKLNGRQRKILEKLGYNLVIKQTY